MSYTVSTPDASGAAATSQNTIEPIMLSTLDAVWRNKFPTVNCAVFYLLHTPSTHATSGNRKIDKEKLIIEVEKKPEFMILPLNFTKI